MLDTIEHNQACIVDAVQKMFLQGWHSPDIVNDKDAEQTEENPDPLGDQA